MNYLNRNDPKEIQIYRKIDKNSLSDILFSLLKSEAAAEISEPMKIWIDCVGGKSWNVLPTAHRSPTESPTVFY